MLEREDRPVGPNSLSAMLTANQSCFSTYSLIISWVMVSTHIWKSESGPDTEPTVIDSTSPDRKFA